MTGTKASPHFSKNARRTFSAAESAGPFLDQDGIREAPGFADVIIGQLKLRGLIAGAK
jgi:hypothetical protein